MAEKDFLQFLKKVEQLNSLIQSLEDLPERKKEFISCSNHNQVVALAKSWGYEIGRRWGEISSAEGFDLERSLLLQPVPNSGEERKLLLQKGANWRLEVIYSCSFLNTDQFWYDQLEYEWILLLRGSATLRIKEPESILQLNEGEHFLLMPHQLHRVEQTDSYPGTIWLALFWDN